MFRLFIAFFVFTALAAAQTVTGSLIGRVTDSTDAAVPNARVVATETTRGVSREATTNDQGVFTISSLDPGMYRVEVKNEGFKSFIKDAVEVTINTTVRVDARLEVGAVSESVEVVAEVVQLTTDRGDLGHQIVREQVENLPLSPDRNYQSLLELVPGSTEPEPVGSAFGNPVGSLANFVNGQNNRGNSFQLDGTINNITNVISQTAIVPPAEAIQVVDVSTNAYDPEHGRATGAVVNVQLKSGTNKFHGSAFAYNTNSALKARNSLSVVDKPYTNLNQFGFTLGGPIRRNRTFFFGDYQGGRDRRGQNTREDVPSPEYRAGNFSGAPNRIFDPLTGTATGANRTQFANNIIPDDRISPIAKRILALLPLPNLPGQVNNYDTSGSFAQDRNAFDVKVNHKFTDLTEGFVSYSYAGAMTSDPPIFGDLGGPNSNGGATAAIGPARNQRASANLTHVFSPTLVTEFRAGLVRVLITGDSPVDREMATKLGIPGINTGDFFSGGIPRINISGYSFLGTNATIPFKIAETSYNFVNNWTKQKGTHSLRWGMDFRNLMLNPYQANGDARGTYTFSAGVTGTTGVSTGSANAFASFLLGLPQVLERTAVVQVGGYRMRQYYFFARDQWQATPKLTVNYGLRYEIAPFAVSANPGDQSRYVADTNQLFIAGYGSVDSRTNVKTDFRNLGPRAGLAYRLGNKTVVRAGYGLSYIAQGINQLSPKNYPSQLSVQVRGANTSLPGGNIAAGFPVVPLVDVSSGVLTSPPGNLVLNAFNPNPRRGYVQSMNFTIERELFGFVVGTSYVNTLGTRMPGIVNLNAAGPGSTVADRPLNRRFGRTADTFINDFMLSSAYHGWQSRAQRRFRGTGTVTISYTLSKSLDYTDAFSLDNDLNIDVNRGPSVFDRKHNLVVSHVTSLPFGRGHRLFSSGTPAAVFGGWRFSGVFSARTGTPVDVSGQRLPENATQGTANRPSVIGPSRTIGGVGPGTTWFDTSVFVEPTPRTFGNAGRNLLRGPGYVNYNLTLSRTFRLRESVSLQALASAFNLTNSAHYRNPSGSFTGAFGRITTSFGERQVRFGARLQF